MSWTQKYLQTKTDIRKNILNIFKIIEGKNEYHLHSLDFY